MKRLFISIISLVFVLHTLVMVPPIAAEDDIGMLAQAAALPQHDVSSVTGGMYGRISLDLRNIDIIEALKFIALKAGINIITTKSVAGRVTLMVQNVVIQDIFDIMLRSNDLAYLKQGDIYNIMTDKEYKEIAGEKFSDIREVKTFRLNYAIPEQAFSLLDTIKSDVGRILVEPDSGTVLIMDTPDKINEIEESLSVLERKNLVQVFTLKYAMAKSVEEQLKAQLDAKKVGSIKADERSNAVVVQALPERMGEIEKLIEALDRKTKEVLIDTQIVKVKLTDALDRGIEWEGLFNLLQKGSNIAYFGSTPFTAVQAAADAWASRKQFLDTIMGDSDIGAYPFSGQTTDYDSGLKRTPGENMHVGMITGEKDFDIIIKYLNTVGDTQILSNPKLAVVNNQEARIHVGERQAYVTETTTTTTGGTETVAEEVTFIDVGIQLSVTPTINDDGFITLKIKPEISSVIDYLVTRKNNRIPIIDTSTAETTVLVKDGSTIVIGGMRKDEDSETAEKVPYLGDIPILGFLFKSSRKDKERTELLIMLTPHIVEGDMLVTGDDRDFEHIGKDYRSYVSITDGVEDIPPQEAPEYRIKPYQEYITLKEEKDYNEGGEINE